MSVYFLIFYISAKELLSYVCSEIPFSKNLYHTKIDHNCYIGNAISHMVQGFPERCCRKDFTFFFKDCTLKAANVVEQY